MATTLREFCEDLYDPYPYETYALRRKLARLATMLFPAAYDVERAYKECISKKYDALYGIFTPSRAEVAYFDAISRGDAFYGG